MYCIFNTYRRLTSETLSYLHLGGFFFFFFFVKLCSYLGFRIDVSLDWPKVKTKETGVAVILSCSFHSVSRLSKMYFFFNCRCIRSKLDSEGDHLGGSDRSWVHETIGPFPLGLSNIQKSRLRSSSCIPQWVFPLYLWGSGLTVSLKFSCK